MTEHDRDRGSAGSGPRRVNVDRGYGREPYYDRGSMERYGRGWENADEQNRGMYGYEGEGYMRDGSDRMPGPRRDQINEGDHGEWGAGRGEQRFGREEEERGARGSSRQFAGDYERANRGYGADFGRDRDLEGMSGRGDSGPQESYRGRGPKNYQRSDERIHEEVCERLAADDEIDATGIEVKVEGGTVRLTGTVDSRRTKRMAEDVVDSVFGVKDVENELRTARGGKQESEKKRDEQSTDR
jgi:osmotically-inducible protein OsmY